MSKPSQWAIHAAGRIGVGDFQADPGRFAQIIQDAMEWAILDRDQRIAEMIKEIETIPECIRHSEIAHAQKNKRITELEDSISKYEEEVGRLRSAVVELETERKDVSELCGCSCADRCPLGKRGMEPRCTLRELRQWQARRIEAMAALLDQVEHKGEPPHEDSSADPDRIYCDADCPRCQWDHLKQ